MDVERSSLCNCVVNFLLEENYVLTAFELLHELLDDGRDAQAIRLKDFFSDPAHFPPDQITRFNSLRGSFLLSLSSLFPDLPFLYLLLFCFFYSQIMRIWVLVDSFLLLSIFFFEYLKFRAPIVSIVLNGNSIVCIDVKILFSNHLFNRIQIITEIFQLLARISRFLEIVYHL